MGNFDQYNQNRYFQRHPNLINKVAILCMLVSMVFIDVVPNETLIASFLFVFFLAILIIGSILSKNRIKVKPDKFLFVFFISLFASYFVSTNNGIDFITWFNRGIFPFLFLIIYFFLPNNSYLSSSFIIKTLVFVCVVWFFKSLTIIILSGEYYSISRFTIITRDLLLPYNLIALAIVLFDETNFTKIQRLIVGSLMLLATAAAGYRAQYLIVVFLFLLYLLDNISKKRVMTVLFITIILGVFIGYFFSTNYGINLFNRFFGESEDSARFKEIEYALTQFISSPVWGVGYGHEIPLEVTFYGRENYLQRLENIDLIYRGRSYLHNLPLYLLMISGLIGFGSYFGYIFYSAFPVRKRALVLSNGSRKGVKWALASILVFNLTAATFTLMQYQVMIVVLTSLLAAKYSVGKPVNSYLNGR